MSLVLLLSIVVSDASALCIVLGRGDLATALRKCECKGFRSASPRVTGSGEVFPAIRLSNGEALIHHLGTLLGRFGMPAPEWFDNSFCDRQSRLLVEEPRIRR